MNSFDFVSLDSGNRLRVLYIRRLGLKTRKKDLDVVVSHFVLNL